MNALPRRSGWRGEFWADRSSSDVAAAAWDLPPVRRAVRRPENCDALRAPNAVISFSTPRAREAIASAHINCTAARIVSPRALGSRSVLLYSRCSAGRWWTLSLRAVSTRRSEYGASRYHRRVLSRSAGRSDRARGAPHLSALALLLAVFNTAPRHYGRPGAGQGLAAIGGVVGVMVGAPAMGFAVQTFGFWAAWLFVGAVAAIAFAGASFIRGEEELT